MAEGSGANHGCFGAHEVEKIAIEQGMVTLPAQGIRVATSGATTLDEVFRVFR